MKRTRITPDLPREWLSFVGDAPVYDSSCSPEARVYYIQKENGYYLKRAPHASLAREATMAAYFHQKGLGPEVLSYLSAEYDWLLTARAAGEDATHPENLSRPEALCDAMASALRALHELPYADCPVPDRMREYFATVEEGYACGRFDATLFPSRVAPTGAEEAYALFRAGREQLSDRVLLHGDYCLPNIMMQNGAVTAFIDVGNGGVGDRHIDLFWGVWTLEYNLKTPRYGTRFLDAYGRDAVNLDLLRTVAAAECFG